MTVTLAHHSINLEVAEFMARVRRNWSFINAAPKYTLVLSRGVLGITPFRLGS